MAFIQEMRGRWDWANGHATCAAGRGLMKGSALLKLQLQTDDSRLCQVEFRFRGRGASRDVYAGNIQWLGDCVIKLQTLRWEDAMLATVATAESPVFEGTLLNQYWHGRLEVDGVQSVGVLEEAVPL
ncbi:MAG: hypothetical protein GY772_24680, partial [bacterium]|nr:hypothetical protein [bacterium]